MKRLVLLSIASCLLLATPSMAEELNTIFNNVNKFADAKNYPKALEELGWAQKELQKMHMAHLQSFIPGDLAGYKGDDFKANSAMGMTNIERIYSQSGQTARIKLSLTGGGSATGGAMGGLAGLGRMAAMMQQQGGGQDTFRIEGKTAALNVESARNRAELSVFLESGSILKLEMKNGADGDMLKKMAESLPIGDLDNYLRGMS